MKDSSSPLKLIATSSRVAGVLVKDCILLGGGPLSSELDLTAQEQIDKIFLVDIHLDYISDIAFMVDSCFGKRDKPFEVWAHPRLIELFKKHFFNNAVWPDFSSIPSKEHPTLIFCEINEGDEIEWQGVKLKAMSGGDQDRGKLSYQITFAGHEFIYASKGHPSSKSSGTPVFFADQWGPSRDLNFLLN